MNIHRIHHVAVICSDYERSKAFYTEVLGFRVIEETYRTDRKSYKLDLEVGKGHQIELFSFPNPALRPSYPEARGLRHLAFAVPDVEEAVWELKGRGVEAEAIRIDPLTGRKFTFFPDPDGLPLELYEEGRS
jgi:glyoxylase I family protein